MPSSDLRNLLHKMQLIESFLTRCNLRNQNSTPPSSGFYAARLNGPLTSKSIDLYCLN